MNRILIAAILAGFASIATAAPQPPKDCPRQAMAPLCVDTKIVTGQLLPARNLGQTWVAVESPRKGPTAIAGTQYWQCLSTGGKAEWKMLANTCR